MVSKIIMDSPELLGETLVSLTEACKCFPIACSRSALERWIRKGIRGIVLESLFLCGKRFTSKEAIDRFVRNQLQVEPKRAEPKRGNKSKQEIAEASKKYKLPEPIRAASE